MNLLLRIVLFIILVVLSYKTVQIIEEKYFSGHQYPSTAQVTKEPVQAPKEVSKPSRVSITPSVSKTPRHVRSNPYARCR